MEFCFKRCSTVLHGPCRICSDLFPSFEQWASYNGWNVSATHSIIGGIVGFAFTWGGENAVFWAEPDSTKVPPIKGVVPIILTWFIAPVITGIAAAIMYGATRYFVLTASNSTERSYYVLPIMVFCTILIDIYFTFTKGAKKQFQQDSNDWDDNKALWISACVAGGLAVLSGIFGIPWLRSKLRAKRAAEDAAGLAKDPNYIREEFVRDDRRDVKTGALMLTASDVVVCNSPGLPHSVADLPRMSQLYDQQPFQQQTFNGQQQFQMMPLYPDASSQMGFVPMTQPFRADQMEQPYVVSGYQFGNGDGGLVPRPTAADLEDGDLKKPAAPAQEEEPSGFFRQFTKQLTKGVDYDIHAVVEEDPMIAAIHANAEKWDPDTEYVFSFLQVL